MINSLALFLPHRRNILISRPSAVAPSSLMRCGFFLFCFVLALPSAVGARVHQRLGSDCQSMGQFSVQLALCHRVLLISTFFFPPPLRPSREVVLVTSLIVNNGFQWEQIGCPLHAWLQVH